MAISILIAFIVAVVTFYILYRTAGEERGLFRRIVLRDRTMTEQGYISRDSRTDLIGKIGNSVTPLRPAGTIVLDNERIDVVTEGNFIDSETTVKIVAVEGMRIVVREVKDKNKEEV